MLLKRGIAYNMHVLLGVGIQRELVDIKYVI